MLDDAVDRSRVHALHAAELARFRDGRPRSLALLDRARAHQPNGVPMAWMASDNDQPVYVDCGSGASFIDVDGFSYIDFNASDMAMFAGHANPAIVEVVARQVVERIGGRPCCQGHDRHHNGHAGHVRGSLRHQPHR